MRRRIELFLYCAPGGAHIVNGGKRIMGFFNEVLNFASIAVTAFGAGIAISGIINFGEGKSQQNAGKQDEGMTKIVGGGIICAVGLFLVPKIADIFSSIG